MAIDVKIKLDEGGKIPVFKHEGDACADAYANLAEDVTIYPHETKIIPLGFKCEFGNEWYMEVRGRSGNAVNGLWIATGTVDSSYRGTVGAITHNASGDVKVIKNGDRIAQVMLKKVNDFRFIETDILSETERADRGFGSSGE